MTPSRTGFRLGEFEEEEYVEVEEKDGKIVKKVMRVTTGENGTEEYIEEIVESNSESLNDKTVRVRRKRSVSRKRTAVFEINCANKNIKQVGSRENLMCYIEKLLFNESKKCGGDSKDDNIPKILIFKDPSIEVKLE